MSFDLNQLRAFVTIVKTGTLGRAAKELSVTQPALSRTVKRLEEQVGAPLFERHSKGMLLTDIGQMLLPHASLLQRESELAREEIDAMRGLAKGTIRVGSVGSIACKVLPDAVERVLKKWPTLHVQVVEGVWDRLADALARYEIDLALAVDLPDTEDILSIKDCRWQDRSVVVAALDHPLRRKSELSLADTLSQSWAIPPKGTGPYVDVQRLFAAHGLGVPNVLVETRSVTFLKSLVARSGFLSWMSEPMIEADRQAGWMDALPIAGTSRTRVLTAFRRRFGVLPAPAGKLLDELRLLTHGSRVMD